MVDSLHADATSRRRPAINLATSHYFLNCSSVRSLAEVELCQLQIARLCNLQINLRTVNYGHWKSSAFDNRGLIGAHKAVCGCVRHRPMQQSEAESLRRLCLDDELTRNGGGDDCTVR